MTTTVAQARAHQHRLESAHRAARRRRAERLSALAPAAAAMLRARYAVAEVLVFGSLATGDLTGDVDVDLAVRGLDSVRYFDALADLMSLFGSAVDLVRLEEASPALRQCIADEGRAL